MLNEKNNRLLEFLKSKGYNSPKELSNRLLLHFNKEKDDKLDISYESIRKFFNEKLNLKDEKIKYLLSPFNDYSLNYILYGEHEGKSLDSNYAKIDGKWQMVQEDPIHYNVTPVDNDNYMLVEYADLRVSAGPLGTKNLQALPKNKTRLVPKEYDKGEYMVLRVDGPSMDNGTSISIPDGTEILVKKYYLQNGDKLPIRNNLFVIDAKEGQALKQITEHNTEQGYITCHSYNPDFKDYKVMLEDILQIFIYRKIVSSRPPIPDIM